MQNIAVIYKRSDNTRYYALLFGTVGFLALTCFVSDIMSHWMLPVVIPGIIIVGSLLCNLAKASAHRRISEVKITYLTFVICVMVIGISDMIIGNQSIGSVLFASCFTIIGGAIIIYIFAGESWDDDIAAKTLNAIALPMHILFRHIISHKVGCTVYYIVPAHLDKPL